MDMNHVYVNIEVKKRSLKKKNIIKINLKRINNIRDDDVKHKGTYFLREWKKFFLLINISLQYYYNSSVRTHCV